MQNSHVRLRSGDSKSRDENAIGAIRRDSIGRGHEW